MPLGCSLVEQTLCSPHMAVACLIPITTDTYVFFTKQMDDAIRYRLLKLLHEQPHLTQRELAKAMGISLGKANFCLRALIGVGAIKVNNFKNSANKSGYLYLLTPRGLEEKARVTRQFLERKLVEYETIQRELEELRGETRQID